MAIVALTSLMSTLELEFLQSTPRPRPRVSVDEDETHESGLMCCLLKRKPSSPSVSLYGQVEMLHKKLCSLQAFLENFKQRRGGAKINDLEIKTRDFALKAEDHIEIQISNYLVAKDGGHPQKASQELHQTLREAAQNAVELLEMLKRTSNEEDDEVTMVGPENVKLTGSSEGRIMVGRHGDRTAINNSLFDEYESLRVIAIVGMMGIGKTCLARSIYNHPSVAWNFQVRTWITLPHEYQPADQTLRDLLSSISGVEPEPVESSRSLSPLQLEIYQRLARRSCLIVLDNLWDNSAWRHIRYCFTLDGRSRILITTTHFDLKSYGYIQFYKHNMDFLPKNLWHLNLKKLGVRFWRYVKDYHN